MRARAERGFTILEVLVALALLLILALPLGWTTVWSSRGSETAREIDDAVALAREEWGAVRRIPPRLLRDSTREAAVGERAYRVARTVVDTVPDAIASGAPEFAARDSAARQPGVRVCVVRLRGDRTDTVRCFGWRVPRVEMQP